MADTESVRELIRSRAPFSAWLGVVLLFALFGIIVLAVVGPSPRGDSYEQMRAKERVKKLSALREEDAKTLNSYAWVDKTKGVARIPIERAMQIAAVELAQKKPTAAGPIATPEAQPSTSPSPAAASSPAPSGTPKPTSVAGPNSEARGQPAAAVNPPTVPPKTQPGASASPAATAVQSKPAATTPPSNAKASAAPGTPIPVRGKTPTPTPTPSNQ